MTIKLILLTFFVRSFILELTFRYKKTNDIENRWYSNEQLIKASSVFLLLVLIYVFIITFVNSHFELRSFNIYSVCLNGQNAQMNHVIFNILTVLVPIITVVVITCIMDYSCYLWLHRIHSNEEIHGCVLSDIPLRATLISTHLFLVGIVVYAVLSSQNIQPQEKYLVATIGAQLYKILRNPLVAIFTFKINDATRQKDADEERKRKQEIEIQDALKRRKKLREKSQNLVSMAMESIQIADPQNDEILVLEKMYY